MEDTKGYLRGIRKAKQILYRYLSRTQDEYLKEIINEFKEILGEKPIKKIENKAQSHIKGHNNIRVLKGGLK